MKPHTNENNARTRDRGRAWTPMYILARFVIRHFLPIDPPYLYELYYPSVFSSLNPFFPNISLRHLQPSFASRSHSTLESLATRNESDNVPSPLESEKRSVEFTSESERSRGDTRISCEQYAGIFIM